MGIGHQGLEDGKVGGVKRDAAQFVDDLGMLVRLVKRTVRAELGLDLIVARQRLGFRRAELARRLAEERPALRILLMSGFADPSAGEPLSAPSGSGFLEKPFTPSELLRRVRETLS